MSLERQLLQNQVANEGRENLDWVLYDSLFTTAASTTMTLTFFQNTIGGVGRARTNMKNAGMLPAPQSFFVTEIGMLIYNNNGTSFWQVGLGAGAAVIFPPNVMVANGFFDLILDPATQYEGHCTHMWEMVHQNMDAPASLLSSGAIQPYALHRAIKFKKPIIIAPNRAFSLQMTLTTPAAAGGYVVANTLIQWYLKGVLRRNG